MSTRSDILQGQALFRWVKQLLTWGVWCPWLTREKEIIEEESVPPNIQPLNKNYYVVRKAGWWHSRDTWKLTLFFINQWMNQSSVSRMFNPMSCRGVGSFNALPKHSLGRRSSMSSVLWKTWTFGQQVWFLTCFFL